MKFIFIIFFIVFSNSVFANEEDNNDLEVINLYESKSLDQMVLDNLSEEEVIEEEKEDSDQESIKKGLEKTKKSFFAKLKSAVLGKSKIDADVLDDLEEILITSDVGVETTVKIIDRIEERVSKDKYSSVNELNKILKDIIIFLMSI